MCLALQVSEMAYTAGAVCLGRQYLHERWYGLIRLKTGINDLVLNLLCQYFAHVGHLLLDELLEELLQTWQDLVLHVVVPGLDPDAIIWSSSQEVLRQVVHDDSAPEVATQVIQVLTTNT